jgi:carboxylesterase type B
LNLVRSVQWSNTLLPTVVYIHGGANLNGQAALYNGTALVAESNAFGLPIIYVGINYRLNGFGFLASSALAGTNNVNLGLYDQELALQWVQSNIENFGGDKNRITILGESAGSVDIWAHISHQGKYGETLFHHAWMLSGTPGGVWPHGMSSLKSMGQKN